jgi:hypothetical protein
MSDFILSQEQKNVLKRVGTLANIVYNDIDLAIQTLFQTIVQNIIHSKSSIIVIPKGVHRHYLKEQLHTVGLKDLMLECDPNALVTEEDLSYIRTHITNDARPAITTDICRYLFNKLNISIGDNLKQLSEKVFGDKSWKQLLHLFLSFDHDDRIYLLHAELTKIGYEFNPKEFNDLYQDLSEVLYLYDRSFEIMDENSEKLGFKSEFLEEDKLQDVTHELFTYKEMAQNIRDRYYSFLHNIEQNKKSELLSLAASISDDLDFLAFKYDQFNQRYSNIEKKKGIFSTFSAPDKSIEKEKHSLLDDVIVIFNSLNEQKVAEKLDSPLQIDQIPYFVNAANLELAKYQDKVDEKVAIYIKSFNKLNTLDEELVSLESDLDTIIKKLNTSGIFIKTFEINTLSFRKQVEVINRLVGDIDMALLRVDKNLAYYRWKSFYLSLEPKSQIIIDILRKIDPQDWLAIFEAWYYYEVLNRHIRNGNTLNEMVLEEAEKLLENHQLTQIFHAAINWKKNYSALWEDLKKTSPKLYNSLSKRKKYPENIYWKHMLEENVSFFSKLFPILIVDSDDLKNIPSRFYTELFYLDPKDTNVEILQDYKTIHTYLDCNRVQGFKGDIHLTEMSHKIVQKIADYSMSERMPAIRNTVQCLLSFQKKPVIYHLRNASIVSFSNENIHTYLEKSLRHFGIKRIVSEESISDTLIATLLDTKKTVFVITDDYLMNDNQIEDYLHQRKQLKAIGNSGCYIMNIDHNELFRKGNVLLEDVSDIIASVNVPKVDQKNQMELEFS